MQGTPRLLLPISFGTIQFLSTAIYAKLNKFIQHSNLDFIKHAHEKDDINQDQGVDKL
jgi:hypothetical protein